MRLAVVVATLAGVAVAQDGGPGGGDLRRAYDDVVNQLKNAQDRKNELAAENEKLDRRIAELEKQVSHLSVRNNELERQAADFAGSTYQYRSTHAAWKLFLDTRPEIRRQWEVYLKDVVGSEESVGRLGDWLERAWPLRQG